MKHGQGEKNAPGRGWPMMKNYAHATGLSHSSKPATKVAMKKTKKGHRYGE